MNKIKKATFDYFIVGSPEQSEVGLLEEKSMYSFFRLHVCCQRLI